MTVPDLNRRNFLGSDGLKSRVIWSAETQVNFCSAEQESDITLRLEVGGTAEVPFTIFVGSPENGGPSKLPPGPLVFGRNVARWRYQIVARMCAGSNRSSIVVDLDGFRWVEKDMLRRVVSPPMYGDGSRKIGWDDGQCVGLPLRSTNFDTDDPIRVTCLIQTPSFPTLLPNSSLAASISVRPFQPSSSLDIKNIELRLVQYTKSQPGTPEDPSQPIYYDPFTVSSVTIEETVTGELWKPRNVEMKIPTLQWQDDQKPIIDDGLMRFGFLPSFVQKETLLQSWHVLKVIVRYKGGRSRWTALLGRTRKAVGHCRVQVAGFSMEDIANIGRDGVALIRTLEEEPAVVTLGLAEATVAQLPSYAETAEVEEG
ncbi:hypothetical protein HK097_005080 [Rhizophlyctis rosea]|uniref:Uncharacterized protein n=1 Tax=Rhizophlyctis rosea TaxID=64517 RepID=A0AAD5X8C8_9FUNG|nr:hypothetical protein HK097_005080 [Rhizophlyctis rosea]